MRLQNVTIDVEEVRRRAEAGERTESIAMSFGVSRSFIGTFIARHGIVKRRFDSYGPRADPTPSEIAERAAYCRRMRELGTPIGE